jgi:hypothetical protein
MQILKLDKEAMKVALIDFPFFLVGLAAFLRFMWT